MVYNSRKTKSLKHKIIRAVKVTSVPIVFGLGVCASLRYGLCNFNVEYNMTKMHINQAITSESIWRMDAPEPSHVVDVQSRINWFTAMFITLSVLGSLNFCIVGGFG